MAKNNSDYEILESKGGGLVTSIDEIKANLEDKRFKHERIWHENNFFDDGFHYRTISPDTRQVLDYSPMASLMNPRRAIPKTSRQIRGVANLLMSNKPTPIIYPENLYRMTDDPDELEMMRQEIARITQRTGQWIEDEWKRQQMIAQKLPHLILLAEKHGIAFIKVAPDAVNEEIRMSVHDAFDLYFDGELNELEDCPVIIHEYPEYISKLRANETYSQDVVEGLVPENRYSGSKIKEDYMVQRYGMRRDSKATDTVNVKETYLKEYLTKSLIKSISKQENSDAVLRNKGVGDVVIRQVVTATGASEPLLDVYTTLNKYPFVDFRMEPGPLYGTPFMERFKHSNKSLDNVVSRVEKIIQTMATGKYWTRDSDKPVLTNSPAGQFLTSNMKPEVMEMPSLPPQLVQYIGLMTSYIEEQGVTTTALGKVPNDIRSGVAIESLKSSEYANLAIAQEQLKSTIKRATELMLDIADDYFIAPKSVFYMSDGKPDFFEVVGGRSAELREKLRDTSAIRGSTVLKKDYRVEIDIENGLGYTIEGRRANAQAIIEVMRGYAQEGYIPQPVVQQVIMEYLKTYQFGSLAEIGKAFDDFDGGQQLTNDQIAQMKIAVVEVLKDVGMIGPDAEQQQVMTSQLGAAQAISDLTQPQQ